MRLALGVRLAKRFAQRIHRRPTHRTPAGPRTRPGLRCGSHKRDRHTDAHANAPTAARGHIAAHTSYGDQPIGALGFTDKEGKRGWNADHIALAEAISEQLALAAENLRLVDETQRRAAREQLTGEVTARMRETLEMEAVLKTAADEMYQALGLDKIVIRLATDKADGDLS